MSKQAAGTPNNYWKKIIVLLCLGWLVIWVYRTMLTPIYAEMQGTIGAQSDAKMGLIASCYFFGYVFTQIPGGMLMDRIGKKMVLIPGFLLFGVGIVVIGLGRSIEAIYVGSVLAGIGTGTYYSGAYTLSSEHVPPERKFLSTAIINNGCAFGMIIGLVASSFLVKTAGLPWQWLVYAVALLAFAMVPVFAVILQKDRKKSPERTEAPVKASAPAADGAARGLGKFFTLELVSSYFLYFCTCYGYYMIATWLPSFLEQERGLTGTAVGMAASIVAVASIPGALFFGKMLDRFRSKKILFLTLLQIAAAVMLVLAASAGSVPLLLVCLALYGITGKQAIDPLIVPHVSELNAKESMSTGLGVFNFFGMSSSILAPFVTGVISDQLGSRVMGFYLAALLLVVSAGLFFLANRRTHKQLN